MRKSTDNIEQFHLHKEHPERLQFELYDLESYRKQHGEKSTIPHSHSYYQIIWFLEDGGSHEVDFKSFDIKKNTILFISKDQIHAFGDKLDVQGWLIHFNESFFMHNDVDIFLKYKIFNSQERPCYVVDGDTVEIGKSYIHLIVKELERRNVFGYEEIIRFSLKSFLIHLERTHQDDTIRPLELNSAYELQYVYFKEMVGAHYKEHRSITQYAAALNISSKTLGTITKSITNKSPSEIIKERIILEAKRLLRFTTLSVGEVAYRTGFDDNSYFVKYFKRSVGVSPLRFREKRFNHKPRIT